MGDDICAAHDNMKASVLLLALPLREADTKKNGLDDSMEGYVDINTKRKKRRVDVGNGEPIGAQGDGRVGSKLSWIQKWRDRQLQMLSRFESGAERINASEQESCEMEQQREGGRVGTTEAMKEEGGATITEGMDEVEEGGATTTGGVEEMVGMVEVEEGEEGDMYNRSHEYWVKHVERYKFIMKPKLKEFSWCFGKYRVRNGQPFVSCRLCGKQICCITRSVDTDKFVRQHLTKSHKLFDWKRYAKQPSKFVETLKAPNTSSSDAIKSLPTSASAMEHSNHHPFDREASLLQSVYSQYKNRRPMVQQLLIRGTEEKKSYWWISAPPDDKYECAKTLAKIVAKCKAFKGTQSPCHEGLKKSLGGCCQTGCEFVREVQTMLKRVLIHQMRVDRTMLNWLVGYMEMSVEAAEIMHRLCAALKGLLEEECYTVEGCSEGVVEDIEWLAAMLLLKDTKGMGYPANTTVEQQWLLRIILRIFGSRWLDDVINKRSLNMKRRRSEEKHYGHQSPLQSATNVGAAKFDLIQRKKTTNSSDCVDDDESFVENVTATTTRRVLTSQNNKPSNERLDEECVPVLLRYIPSKDEQTGSHVDPTFSIFIRGIYSMISTGSAVLLPSTVSKLQHKQRYAISNTRDKLSFKGEHNFPGYVVRQNGSLSETLGKQISRNRKRVEEERKRYENELTNIEKRWLALPCKVNFSLIKQSKLVYIGPSKIHGMGAFAMQHIKRGEFVIEYIGEVLNEEIWNSRLDRREKRYEWEHGRCYVFSTMCQKYDQYIDATVSGNVSRFINHSCEPNCESMDIADKADNGSCKVGIFSLRDIYPGEELLYRYEFSEKATEMCYCGTDSCEGVM